ncbi:Uncharacterized protein dnm_042050 [Desulfonema magnum]|uniref:Uncharacterized protein n=1 Tax=Desulfonema magnum TaxID=45655 RepID=A0A975BNI1_9BACT|nr:Uncharacterized protein dnm_042050 [Desulfonema magnum]
MKILSATPEAYHKMFAQVLKLFTRQSQTRRETVTESHGS